MDGIGPDWSIRIKPLSSPVLRHFASRSGDAIQDTPTNIFHAAAIQNVVESFHIWQCMDSQGIHCSSNRRNIRKGYVMRNQETSNPNGNDAGLLPHSVEAEKAVIAAILGNNDAWNEVSDFISAEEFFQEEHKFIFRHIATLMEIGTPAHAVNLMQSLRYSNDVASAGGESYLKEIFNTNDRNSIRYYARIIWEKAMLRSLIRTCNEISRTAVNSEGRSGQQVLDEATSRIIAIVESKPRFPPRMIPLADALDKLEGQFANPSRYRTRVTNSAISTGFEDLDRITSGLRHGDVAVLAAASNTSSLPLAIYIAGHVGLNLDLPVLVLNIDTSAMEEALHILSISTGIGLLNLRADYLSEEERANHSSVLDRMRRSRIHIAENRKVTFLELRAQARRVHRQCKGLGLILIEDVQIIRESRVIDDRACDLQFISSQLKYLAMELDAAIIILSQLPHVTEESAGRSALNSELRSLGGIEQDADLVLLINKQGHATMNDAANTGAVEVRVAKHRNGMKGKCDLRIDKGISSLPC